MNKEWLEKCFEVAEKLYCVFTYDVLKQLYARGGYGELSEDEAVEFGKMKRMEYVDATLSEFEDMEPGFFRPELIDEDDEKYEEVKKQADAGDQYNRMHLYENEIDELLMEQGTDHSTFR